MHGWDRKPEASAAEIGTTPSRTSAPGKSARAATDYAGVSTASPGSLQQRRDDNLRRLAAAGPEHVRRYLAALPQPTREQVVRELVRVAPQLSSAIRPAPARSATSPSSAPAFDDAVLAAAGPGAHWGPFGEIVSPPKHPSVQAFEQATHKGGGEVPYRAEMEARFATSFGTVRAHLGRAELGQLGAHAAARGETVAFASAQPDPAIVAHELTHVVQQRRAGASRLAAKSAVGAASSPAEQEADAIADVVARQGPLGPTVHLSAAPDGLVHFERGGTHRRPSSQGAVASFRIDGEQAIINAAWLRGDPGLKVVNNGIYAPARMSAILAGFKAAGIVYWLRDADIPRLSRTLVLAGPLSNAVSFRAVLAPAILAEVGLPPDVEVQWRLEPGGGATLAVAGTRLRSLLRHAGRVPIPRSLIATALEALELQTGIEIASDKKQFLVEHYHPDADVAHLRRAWLRRWTRKNIETYLYDRATWSAYLAGGHKAGSSDAKRTPARFLEGISAADRQFYLAWLAKHRVGGRMTTGTIVSYNLIHALRALDAHPRQKRLVLQRLQASPAGRLTGNGLLQLLVAVDQERANKRVGRRPPRHNRAHALFNEAVTGTIVNRGGKIFTGKSVQFDFALDNAHGGGFATDIDWIAHPANRPTQHIASERTHAPFDRKDYFNVTFHDVGVYTIHAFVRHPWYLPAHFSTQVMVKTESTRLAEQQESAFKGLAALSTLTKRTKEFDIGFWSKVFGDYKHDHGTQFTGPLPADFKHKTFEQRKAFIAADRRRVFAVIKAYADSVMPEHKALVAYARHYLKTLRGAEARMRGVKRAGYTFFEARGAFLSHNNAVPDGPLRLVAAAKRLADGRIRIELHDHTKLYDPESYYFSASAGSFTNAVEAAFLKLCKSYPPGRVSLLVERLDRTLSKPSGQVYGLQLHTGTAWKDFKRKVFDPAVKWTVNLAGALTMILAPFTAPVLFPVLAAYNITEIADDLAEMKRKGILTNRRLGVGLAQIAVQLLPYLGNARFIGQVGGKALLAIDGINVGIGVVAMTLEGQRLLTHLRDLHVREIAREQAAIAELERINPADPTLAARKQALQKRIVAARAEATKLFAQMMRDTALMVLTPLVFNHIQNRARLRGSASLIDDGAMVHADGKTPAYDPATNRIVGDTKHLDEPSLGRARAQLEAELWSYRGRLAELLGTERSRVAVHFGKRSKVTRMDAGEYAVTVGKGDTFADVHALARAEISRGKLTQPAHEPGRRQTTSAPPTRAQAEARGARARAIIARQKQRSAELEKLVDAEEHPYIAHITVGASTAATLNHATLAHINRPKPGQKLSHIPDAIAIASDYDWWQLIGDWPIGQPVGDYRSAGYRHQPGDFNPDHTGFAHASDVAYANATTAYDTGMYVYRGTVTEVQQRAKQGDWAVKDATWRVRVKGKWLYTKHVDWAGGLGASRKHPVFQGGFAKKLIGAGKLVYAQDGFVTPGKSGGVVGVIGDSASAGWAAKKAALEGHEVVIIAPKPDMPRAPEHLRAELAKLGVTIYKGYVKAAELHNGRVVLSYGDKGATVTVDGVSMAIGQTPAYPKGFEKLRFRAIRRKDATGKERVVGLETFGGPEGSEHATGVRVLGAAMTNMPERLPGRSPDEKANVEGFKKFKRDLNDQVYARSVPRYSHGIAPAIHNTAKDIPLANKEAN